MAMAALQEETTTTEIVLPLRVLLVDDDEFDVAVFRRAFRKSEIPCEIMRCSRAEDVLEERLRLKLEEPLRDLVRVEKALSKPALEGSQAETCRRAGMDDVVPRPVSPKALREALARSLDSRSLDS